jgi:hypothetical protein
MSLSHIDIERISRQGYRFKDFVVKRKRERHLKNRNGRCVFLGEGKMVVGYILSDPKDVGFIHWYIMKI